MESHTYDHVAQRDFHIEKLATSMSRFLCLTNEWLASHKFSAKKLDIQTLQQTAQMIQMMTQMRTELDHLMEPESTTQTRPTAAPSAAAQTGNGANGHNGDKLLPAPALPPAAKTAPALAAPAAPASDHDVQAEKHLHAVKALQTAAQIAAQLSSLSIKHMAATPRPAKPARIVKGRR